MGWRRRLCSLLPLVRPESKSSTARPGLNWTKTSTKFCLLPKSESLFLCSSILWHPCSLHISFCFAHSCPELHCLEVIWAGEEDSAVYCLWFGLNRKVDRGRRPELDNGFCFLPKRKSVFLCSRLLWHPGSLHISLCFAISCPQLHCL